MFSVGEKVWIKPNLGYIDRTDQYKQVLVNPSMLKLENTIQTIRLKRKGDDGNDLYVINNWNFKDTMIAKVTPRYKEVDNA